MPSPCQGPSPSSVISHLHRFHPSQWPEPLHKAVIADCSTRAENPAGLALHGAHLQVYFLPRSPRPLCLRWPLLSSSKVSPTTRPLHMLVPLPGPFSPLPHPCSFSSMTQLKATYLEKPPVISLAPSPAPFWFPLRHFTFCKC